MATTVKIGDITVGMQGFGCMGISAFYGNPMKDADGAAVVESVFKAEPEMIHFDTAEIYRSTYPQSADGPDTKWNEVAVGIGVKAIGSDKVTVATKFMPGCWEQKTDLETVEKSLDASLARLGMDCVDVYYCHRMAPQGPEEFMASAKALIAKGKIKQVGLSECSADQIRKAHAVHPVAVVQLEWSIVSRSIEEKIVPVCKELGITIVAYSPLSRNLLTDTSGEGAATNFKGSLPRFQGENLEKNKLMIEKVKAMGAAKKVTVAQLSLAWLYYKAAKLGVSVLPIPGTTKVPHFVENFAATKISLTDEEAAALEAVAAEVNPTP
ncbi:NADP-dependent oxidoreductase domain-containing protein [Baffinella frigidus]|nr:NADP-dependent oxidoreductase domain-containing protein [Cryptophyta sp. CCMP2293]